MFIALMFSPFVELLVLISFHHLVPFLPAAAAAAAAGRGQQEEHLGVSDPGRDYRAPPTLKVRQETSTSFYPVLRRPL